MYSGVKGVDWVTLRKFGLKLKPDELEEFRKLGVIPKGTIITAGYSLI